MARGLAGKVVVVIGASSGIGRETALQLARKGAHLVLVARREDPLHTLEARCAALGAEVLVIPADVSIEEEVAAVAEAAAERFGSIDAWVNDAGVYAVGKMEQTPTDVYRRLMEVNYLGTVYGTRAAVAQLRRHGRGGVIVNVGSQLSSISAAYESAYTASKHAVRGFSSAVRQELLDAGISVCTVMPAGIDTPLFDHSANFTGKKLQVPAPVYPPEKVAKVILRMLVRPRPESYVGTSAVFMGALRHLFPRVFDRLMRNQMETGHFRKGEAPTTRGNLDAPVVEGTGVHGAAKGRTRQWLRRAAVALALGAGAVGISRAVSARA